MRRTPSPRGLIAALIADAESDAGTYVLQELLGAHGPALTEALGADASALAHVYQCAPAERSSKLRSLAQRASVARTEAHQRAAHDLSIAAATMLGSLARFHDDRVELEACIVLGNLLADRAVKFIELSADGYDPVAVSRSKLREAKQALPFPSVRCFLDSRGLHFRWREEKGGLTFWPQDVRREDRDRVLVVPIARAARIEQRSLEPATPIRIRHPATLLGDVLSELNFL